MNTKVHQQIKTRGAFSVETRNTLDGSYVSKKCFSQNNVVTQSGRDWVANLTSLDLVGRRTQADGVSRSASRSNHDMGLGTGTSEIVETDTHLGGTVVIKEASGLSTEPSLNWVDKLMTVEVKRRLILAPGEATGTWGQVGFWGWYDGARKNLSAGQALRDSEGNLTTVTFTEFEEVTIYYSLFITVPIGHAITEDYDYSVMPPVEHMTTLETRTETIKGSEHQVYVGRGSTFCQGFGAAYRKYYREYDDGLFWMTIKNEELTFGGSNIVVYSKLPEDEEYSATQYRERDLDNLPSPFLIEFEEVDFGKLYRHKIRFSLPYDVVRNREIKAIGLVEDSGVGDLHEYVPWASGIFYINNLNRDRFQVPHGVVRFEPSVFKEDGDEFEIEMFVYVEVS